MFQGPKSGPDTVAHDDPGPWSVATPVFRMRSGRADRRRAMPPLGFTLAPPPATGLEMVGLDPEATAVGGGRVHFTAGVREPARAITFAGDRVETVSPLVARSYALPGLDDLREERPDADPAADVAEPTPMADFASAPDAGVVSPDGSLRAVTVAERGAVVIAVVRTTDNAVVRWMRGCWTAAWSDDGQAFAVGGDWGLVLAEAIAPSE